MPVHLTAKFVFLLTIEHRARTGIRSQVYFGKVSFSIENLSVHSMIYLTCIFFLRAPYELGPGDINN